MNQPSQGVDVWKVNFATYAYWFLTDWEFDFGIIGLSEYVEREEVFKWLVDDSEAINDGDLRGEAQTEEQETPLGVEFCMRSNQCAAPEL